ncbi:MAG: phosphatidate cytidylyltransferase, partial [Saprospiraceae bacterium]|nr:phosphatidate cytidylyltransferase [Saprospiraceae bacterium]
MSRTELGTRVLTSVVIGGAIIGLILGGEATTAVLVSGICLLAGRELFQLVAGRRSVGWSWGIAAVLVAPVVLHVFYPVSPGDFGGAGIIFDWIPILSIPVLAGSVLLLSLRSEPEVFYKHLTATALGITMITIPGLFALQLAALTPLFLLGIFLLIWTSDIFAYFIGKKWGRAKLLPR